jgi:(R,R)-butanediol dehydrogenase / meso-butanediol dehydrogenase / diacetyl reductase
MGEFAAVPEQNVVKLPDTVSDEQGALLEPSAVAVNAIDAAGVVAGSTVLITGAGPIGALVALAARAAGASKIFVYELPPNQRTILRKPPLRRIPRGEGDPGTDGLSGRR